MKKRNNSQIKANKPISDYELCLNAYVPTHTNLLFLRGIEKNWEREKETEKNISVSYLFIFKNNAGHSIRHYFLSRILENLSVISFTPNP